MDNIVFHLIKFFKEQQDEAAIPRLGVFYKSSVTSNGNLPENTFAVLYLEKQPRSNAFINFFSYEMGITQNEGANMIDAWVNAIFQDLKDNKTAVIEGLGTYRIKAGNKLSFDEGDNLYEYDTKNEDIGSDDDNNDNDIVDDNTNDDDYGLETADNAPLFTPSDDDNNDTTADDDSADIEEDTPDDSQPKRSRFGGTASYANSRTTSQNTNPQNTNTYTYTSKSSKKSLMWIIIAAAVVCIVVAYYACYKTIPAFESWNDNLISSLSSKQQSQTIIPIDTPEAPIEADETTDFEDITDESLDDVPEPLTVANETSADETVATTPAKPAPISTAKPATSEKTSKPQKEQQGKFYIVCGSYKEKQNAENFKASMLKQGFKNTEILYKADKAMYYVYVNMFNTRDEAHQYRTTLIDKHNIDSWVMY